MFVGPEEKGEAAELCHTRSVLEQRTQAVSKGKSRERLPAAPGDAAVGGARVPWVPAASQGMLWEETRALPLPGEGCGFTRAALCSVGPFLPPLGCLGTV